MTGFKLLRASACAYERLRLEHYRQIKDLLLSENTKTE